MNKGILKGDEKTLEIEYLLSEMYKMMERKRYINDKAEIFVVVDTLLTYDGNKCYLSVVYCPECEGIINSKVRFSSKVYEFLEKFSEVE